MSLVDLGFSWIFCVFEEAVVLTPPRNDFEMIWKSVWLVLVENEAGEASLRWTLVGPGYVRGLGPQCHKTLGTQNRPKTHLERLDLGL